MGCFRIKLVGSKVKLPAQEHELYYCTQEASMLEAAGDEFPSSCRAQCVANAALW